MEENYVIKDSKCNFTIIPNYIFDLGLSVYAVRLYCELKRVAGEDGACWVNTENLSKRCNMSTGSVSDSKKELEEKGLINIELKSLENKHYHEITITDIWGKNYQNKIAGSPHELAGSPHEPAGSPGERINIHNNKIQKTRTKEELIESTKQAMLRGYQKGRDGGISSYPEELREVLLMFSDLWKMDIPILKSRKAFWISGGRELLSACAECGVDILKDVRKEFENYMALHNGLAPYTVSSPKSLINPVTAAVSVKRTVVTNPYKEAGYGAAELWIGGVKVS